MQGRRIPNPEPSLCEPGDYYQGKDGYWTAQTPNGHYANLRKHEVTEHEDGTITVSPSILVSDGIGPVWHGYIKHGVWEEC